MQGFIDHLSRVPGRPEVKRWDLDTFFGTYRVTPFGVHRDAASVFSFLLMGERTYYTWPPDYFADEQALYTPDPDKIAPHLAKAEVFHLKPGEVFYWPSNRWHVVMSDGRPSVVAQISAYFKYAQTGGEE